MDASQSALDSLRTVEFRETLKGYHRDDVDEYLEKAAIEAEGLQEQLRQSGERLRQAAERISHLESAAEQAPAAPQPAETAVADDTLQRTLVLAQKFVDETKADAESRAASLIADADAKARMVTDQATAQATHIAAESEQRLKEEISRLEDSRGRLSHEVEAMSRHLESERNRLRAALGDILRWVDQNVQPAPSHDKTPTAPAAAPAEGPPPSSPGPATGSPQATVIHGGNRSAAGTPAGSPAPSNSGTGPNGEVTQVRPAGAPAPANPNAPLPL
ncbi:MAG TPA: DivIVA domain-containing protein [Acidimicrobiales bacterium]|jgi:DivIVA domain-containing protein